MKLRLSRFVLALVVLVLMAGLPASAGRINLTQTLCLDQVFDFEPERSWVPVGCEVIDCCQDCPGPPIDWRINVSGEILETVVLRFENLPPETTKQLAIKGNGKWDGVNLIVGPGETIVSGFQGDSGDVPAVANPRLQISKEKVRNLMQSALTDKGDDSRKVDNMAVEIKQMRGDFVVNESSLSYLVTLCPRPAAPNDRIDLNNNTTNDNAVVLLDARNGNGVCLDDSIWRGNDIINLGSVITNGTCNSEVAVFSDDNAMEFVTPVNSWTDPVVDTLPVALDPILEAPVTVWMALANAQERAEADIANANLLYNSNNVGVTFNATFQDVSGNQNAVNTITTPNNEILTICNNIANIQASAFFTPNRLNVYYVDFAFTGVNCGGNRSIQFIGTTSNNQSLAHEFGHSFSLVGDGGHTNNLAGFDGTNVMQGGGAGRTHFSEGQAFRINLNATSTLNVNGVRNGTTRNCTPVTVSNTCPRLALNANPK